EPAASVRRQKLPFVSEAQLLVLLAQLCRKRIEGGGEAQDRERRLIDLLIPARATRDRGSERAVGSNGDLPHRFAGRRSDTGDLRKMDRPEPLHLASPCIEIGREPRLARVRNDLEGSIEALASQAQRRVGRVRRDRPGRRGRERERSLLLGGL